MAAGDRARLRQAGASNRAGVVGPYGTLTRPGADEGVPERAAPRLREIRGHLPPPTGDGDWSRSAERGALSAEISTVPVPAVRKGGPLHGKVLRVGGEAV